MPGKKQDNSQVVSVRLPHELVRRLDRYLDWSAFYRRVKSSRNAAMRDALSNWLDHQEQLAGFLEPQAQCEQFQAVYRSIAKRRDWAAIHQLRDLLPWPRERFDTVLEGLRADPQVELERAEPAEMSDPAIQDSYQVHGQLYSRLRWHH
ncbi:MAG TPA: ribbon-helix-helix domain-containing protein [Candidatus Binatia bacterium]|nr:ribbon-helix-helix domain-containing protein [Candidatus Binatia bacterium]